jgi:hypothetical protein
VFTNLLTYKNSAEQRDATFNLQGMVQGSLAEREEAKRVADADILEKEQEWEEAKIILEQQ